MRHRRGSGSFSEQLAAGSSGSSNITNSNNDRCGDGSALPEARGSSTSSNTNLFGGMEVLKTRQKRRGMGTVDSHAPHEDSPISLPPKDQLLPSKSSTKGAVFFLRCDMPVDSVQDDVEDPQVTRMRERLERFYNEYSPSLLSGVENTIKSFVSREEELFELLVTKYGPEPMILQPSVLPKSDFVNQTTQSEAGSVFDFIQSGPKSTYGENIKNINSDFLVNPTSSLGFSIPQTSVKESDNRSETSAPGAISAFSFIETDTKDRSVLGFVAVKPHLNELVLENRASPAAIATSMHREQSEYKREEEKEKQGEVSLPLLRNSESDSLKTSNNNDNDRSGADDSVSNSSKGRKGRSGNKSNEENLWDRQRREIGEFQGDVLLARTKLAHVLDQIRNSILERCDAMSKVREVEEAIEKSVAQEAFDQADILCNELENLASRVAELDAEPTRLLVVFAQCKEELNSAVRDLAHLLLRHSEELVACKDDEEKRVKQFISDMSFSFENRSDKLAAALERAQRTKSNALQETANLRDRKLKIREKLQQQSKTVREQQEQLTFEIAELNMEIAALEVKLTQLRQIHAEKTAASEEVSSNVQCMTEECEAIEDEVDALLKEEEARVNAATADIEGLTQINEALEREKSEFEAKKDFLLSELQGGEAKVERYEEWRVLLETSTIETLQRCSNALEAMLRTRAAGRGVLYTAVPSLLSEETSAEASPLARVHHLQQQLHTLNSDDERNAALVTSLGAQVAEMQHGIPLLEDAKKSAVLAKRFKEAQLKAEELRALTVSIEELTAAKEAAQEVLRTNAAKRTVLERELADEQAKASKDVKEFLDHYHNLLSVAMEATAILPNVLQTAVDEHRSDDLAEAAQELLETLQEEWLNAPQMGNKGVDGDVANVVSDNSKSDDGSSTHKDASNDAAETTLNAVISPTDSTIVTTAGEEIDEQLLVLQKRQNDALGPQDCEACEPPQEQIEAAEKLLYPQASNS